MVEMLITFTLVTVAVARVTRFVTHDKLTDPFRSWVARSHGADRQITYLLFCPMCISVWIAAAATPPAWFMTDAPHVLGITSWLGLPVVWLSVAYVAGFITSREASK